MTEMRLSEAIRLGAMLRPQGRDVFMDEQHRTCALGAALDAIGQLDRRGLGHIPSQWEWCWYGMGLDGDRYPCPAGRCSYKSGALRVITHVNDHHGWTRERIADWVATIEPREEPPAAVADVAVSPWVCR